ncbi:substrate-binding domain-containing protein [Acidisoma cellulosilytica]|uniref:Substrate-binding domain-containing protein n=1 Tax=Acidisoma cellulosilyticum TaxID=2802395 RepID=A0A963Z435_9PROT|nr:substrate-binding domain-containing protein [Acidisoma cellulosilyticum]MCB8882249.1 substrate-binding domain-containing protein [Acidisoma cellulosilyticum]
MKRRALLAATASAAAMGLLDVDKVFAADKQIVYLTPGLDLPFWRAVAKGVGAHAKAAGYDYKVFDSHNSAQTQLQNAQDAIARNVAGIVISPTDSSTAPSVLALAQRNGIPVVICDIGTNGGDYVSFIKSDNYKGAYGVGAAFAKALIAKGYQKDPFGLVTISLARKNGQDRTNGFRDAMKAAGLVDQAALKQMASYTTDETYKFVQDMLTASPNLHGIFVETDQPTLGAIQALKAANRQNDVLVASFDGIPEFIDLLKSGQIVVAGMQQPYLMGNQAADALLSALKGGKPAKEILVPIMIATHENIDSLVPVANKTVFALGDG